jgi:hypothetical protein
LSKRLSDLRVQDPVLTELATGYNNEDYVAENLFPVVSLEKEGGKIPKFGKEQFKLYNTERAIRAKSNRINPSGVGAIEFVMSEHDIEYPMDYREESEANINLEIHATNFTSEVVAIKKEVMCAKLAQDPTNYAAGSKITLIGASKFSDPASDPISVIENAKLAISKKIIKKPNTMVIGKNVYAKLKYHPQLVEKIKYSMKGIVSVDIMREIFEIKNIVVGEAMYCDDKDELFDIWGNTIVLAYVTQTEAKKRTAYEPTFAYTLRKKNNPIVDTYEEAGKLKIVRNTDIFVPKIVGADAGYLISEVI